MCSAKTIVEEELVAARIDKATYDYPVLTTAYDGLKWRLARDPFCGTQVPDVDEEYYLAKMPTWGPGGKPLVTVLYQITEYEVPIKSSKIETPKNKVT